MSGRQVFSEARRVLLATIFVIGLTPGLVRACACGCGVFEVGYRSTDSSRGPEAKYGFNMNTWIST